MAVNIPIVVSMRVEESDNIYNLNVASLDNTYALEATNDVNVFSPAKTSDLVNDGDGTSCFTTEEYVRGYHDSTKQNALTSDNAGSGIAITENDEGDIIISNTQTSAEWGNIVGDIASQADLVGYVAENGGKIDSISVNGTEQTIVNKNVNIEAPTKTSDLINDSDFITPSDLSSVAFSGDYHDLNNQPEIPSLDGYATETYVQNYHDSAKQNIINNSNKLSVDYISGLANVATSGSYSDLSNKPSIPTNTSALVNDSNFIADTNYVHTDNNFTSTEKTKLNSIESGAEVNKINTIQVNGVSLTINNKTVDVPVPTTTSQLTNNSGFITNAVNNLTNYYLKSETYTQAEVNSLIGAITTIDIRVVQQLPTTDISTTTIYFTPKQNPVSPNIYDEYVYVNNSWELIGTTQIDLSDYYTKTQVDNLIVDFVTDTELSTALANKQDVLTAGNNINISNNTISAIDTTYTAGNGLSLTGTEFSADTSVLATKSDLNNYYTETETDNLLGGNVDKVEGKGLSTEDFTTADKTKLTGIEAGAEVNVNADWNATSGDAEILNKPTIPTITMIDWTVN